MAPYGAVSDNALGTPVPRKAIIEMIQKYYASHKRRKKAGYK